MKGQPHTVSFIFNYTILLELLVCWPHLFPSLSLAITSGIVSVLSAAVHVIPSEHLKTHFEMHVLKIIDVVCIDMLMFKN